MDLDSDVRVTKTRTYQVYRGMSPSTSNRLEVSVMLCQIASKCVKMC